MSQSSFDDNFEMINPQDIQQINDEINQIEETIKIGIKNGQTMATSEQTKAVFDFIKKNNALLQQRRIYMVYGHKTREELVSLINYRLITKNQHRFSLITQFEEESVML